MPTLFAANESSVLINGQPVDGVRAVEYRFQQSRQNVYALGTAERIGMVSGGHVVEGRLRVASTAQGLDALIGGDVFQMTAMLRHGETTMTVTLDECYLMEKFFEMAVGGHGEAVYAFTATRIREEIG